jgi:hypothetical protein
LKWRSASESGGLGGGGPSRIIGQISGTPDLNPIEQLFSKVKTLVRKAAPRSLDAVSDAIANALAAVPHSECANYFTNSGYAHN